MRTAIEILNGDYQSTGWIVKELLPVGLNLTGMPKAGKSWLWLQVAKSVATGESFLGYKVRPGGVVFYALEDSTSRLAERMRLQGWNSSKLNHPVTFHTMNDIEGNLLEHPLPPPANGTSLVIIDTLSAAFGGNQVSHPKIRQLFIDLRDYAHGHQVCVVVVDHRGKSGSIFGSMAKTAFADSIWYLEKTGISIEGKDTKVNGVRAQLEKGIWTESPEAEAIEETYKHLIQHENGEIYTVELSKPRNGMVTVGIGKTSKGLFGIKTKTWMGRMEVSEIAERLMRSNNVRRVG